MKKKKRKDDWVYKKHILRLLTLWQHIVGCLVLCKGNILYCQQTGYLKNSLAF